MPVVVVTPPAALVTADEAKAWAPVLAGDGQVRIDALLAAAQAALEPPSWLGSSLGKQTLKAWLSDWPTRKPLPYGPVTAITEVKYSDPDGEEHTLADDAYRLLFAGTILARLGLRPGVSWPTVTCGEGAIRVTYEAGYEPADPRLAPAKHAIVLSALALRSLGTQDLTLRSVEVPGIDTRTWTVSDAASKLVKDAVGDLLSQYWAPGL